MSLNELKSLMLPRSNYSQLLSNQLFGPAYNKKIAMEQKKKLNIEKLTITDLTPEKIKSLTNEESQFIDPSVIIKFSPEQIIAFADKYKDSKDIQKIAIKYNLREMNKDTLEELTKKVEEPLKELVMQTLKTKEEGKQ